jgi:transcriptional/translational regulatory protein YebC/TACO1
MVIEGITDNKNRTLEGVKSALSKHGGKLAEPGSVRWLFKHLGRLNIEISSKEKEDAELKAIEAGAVETEWDENFLMAYVLPEKLEEARQSLTKSGLSVSDYSLEWVAPDNVVVSENDRDKLNKLLEVLSDQDDIQEVYFNAEL